MNIDNHNKNNIYFGYASKLKKMIAEEYPYCAYTKKRFGKGLLGRSTDHINAQFPGGKSSEENYIVVIKEINFKKGHMNFREFIYKHKNYIKNIVIYYESLLKSKNKIVAEYAKASLNTVLEELSGMYSDISSRKIILTKKL